MATDVKLKVERVVKQVVRKWQTTPTAWRVMDQDKSGTISRAEFEHGLMSSGAANISKPVMEALWAKLHADQHGEVSYKSFRDTFSHWIAKHSSRSPERLATSSGSNQKDPQPDPVKDLKGDSDEGLHSKLRHLEEEVSELTKELSKCLKELAEAHKAKAAERKRAGGLAEQLAVADKAKVAQAKRAAELVAQLAAADKAKARELKRAADLAKQLKDAEQAKLDVSKRATELAVQLEEVEKAKQAECMRAKKIAKQLEDADAHRSKTAELVWKREKSQMLSKISELQASNQKMTLELKATSKLSKASEIKSKFDSARVKLRGWPEAKGNIEEQNKAWKEFNAEKVKAELGASIAAQMSACTDGQEQLGHTFSSCRKPWVRSLSLDETKLKVRRDRFFKKSRKPKPSVVTLDEDDMTNYGTVVELLGPLREASAEQPDNKSQKKRRASKRGLTDICKINPCLVQ
ncbi:hypothetical protein AAMO2058_000994600 [Amorphochlora amoebiformis]|mmetsp:Transcript_5279/g.7954  ORF Transcript_5279/g.7954 Transcript_5279/m.7954 type:complete len:463 (-) Transcript_5279:130-1518(-)